MNLKTAIFNHHCDHFSMTLEKKEEIKIAKNPMDFIYLLSIYPRKDVINILNISKQSNVESIADLVDYFRI